MITRIIKQVQFIGLGILASGAIALASTTVNSVPSGYFTLNITAGTGAVSAVSTLSFPLQGTATTSGQMVGTITALTANTFSNTAASWVSGQLSQAATPYLIQITSGTAAGRTFLISTSTANTTTTATIDSVDAAATDLTTLGITAGTDTYQIIPADTISSIFGTPASTGIQGGTSQSSADQVLLLINHVWVNYYYNSTSGWLKVGPPIPSGNVVIRPDTAVMYSRLASTPMSITLMGRVPSVQRQALISNGGLTYLSNNWPVAVTLANSNIQNTPGWKKGSSSVADMLQVYTSSNVWKQYYHNGTNWVQVGPPINSDSVLIPAGSAVILSKAGSPTGSNVLTQSVPYSL